MTNTKVSKVMLSTLVTGGLVFIFMAMLLFAQELETPNATKEETQIELPSSELVSFRYNLLVPRPSLEEIREEGERFLVEQEAEKEAKILKLQLEWEEIKKAKEAEEARLAKIEAEKKRQDQLKEGVEFNGSYYTPYCKGCSGITATGYDVQDTIYYKDMRIIAVDPKVIPLYSIVEVSTPNETFKAIALDKGGAIKGHKVDILVADKKTAKNLGRHSVYIEVLEYGD